MHRTLLLVTTSLAAALFFGSAATADPVKYTMKAGGVSCAGSAAHAEMAVSDKVPVTSVEADPVNHSVTASFDDDVVSLASVVESLEEAGIAVGEPVLVD